MNDKLICNPNNEKYNRKKVESAKLIERNDTLTHKQAQLPEKGGAITELVVCIILNTYYHVFNGTS